jgi:ADP-ribosyl-[dinitrogen reductase] hydrolase
MNNTETVSKKNTQAAAYEPKFPEKSPAHAEILKDNLYHEDRILGAVFGNAVGDALGAPAEFNGREGLISKYPDGLREMTAGGLTGGKIAGSYTDDTEMLVAIAKGVVEAGEYNLGAIGKAFMAWRDGGPADIGGQTSRAISAMRNKGMPIGDAGYATLSEGSEGNGSIMRNGIVFVLTRNASLSEALTVADNISALTHASHQCRSSCAAMTYLQRALCGAVDPKTAIERTATAMERWGAHAKVVACLKRVINEDYTSAGKMPTSGYVIDTLERAVWCLWHDLGFEEGIVTCIMQGGDADSAGAVCGSLLGTYYGYSAIPERYLTAVRASEAKHRDCSLEQLTHQVAEIGDKYFQSRR